MFSDTGGTIPIDSPNGRVKNVPQPSPLTGSWLASADSARPFKEPNSVDFQGGDLHALQQPVGVTFSATNFTISIAFQQRGYPISSVTGAASGASSWCRYIWGTDGVGAWGIEIFGRLRFAWNGHVTTTGIDLGPDPTVGDLVVLTCRGSATGLIWQLTVNGTTTTGSASAAFAGTVSGLILGSNPAGQVGGLINCAQFAAYSRQLSDAETTALHTFMIANLPSISGFPTNVPLLGVTGDSIACGSGVTTNTAWQWLTQKAFYAETVPPRLLNNAISGYTVANAISEYPLHGSPFYSSRRSRNIMVVAVGTNSMMDAQALSAATILAQLYSLCDTIRADGWKVALCTILPRTDAGATGHEAKRTIINSDIITNGLTHADAIANVGAIVGMGTPADCSGPNYQLDQVHPNTLGHALMLPVIAAAVSSLLYPGNFSTVFTSPYAVAQTDLGLTYGNTLLKTAGTTGTTTVSVTGTISGVPVPVAIKPSVGGAGAIGSGASFDIFFDGGTSSAMTGVTPLIGIPIALTGAGDGLRLTFSAGTVSSDYVAQATCAGLADVSGNGKNFVQTTASLQPLITPGVNGYPGLLFDGVDDFLAASNLSLPAPATTPGCCFLVGRIVNWAANTRLMSASGGNGGYCLGTVGSSPTISGICGAFTALTTALPVNAFGAMQAFFQNSIADYVQVGSGAAATGTSANSVASTNMQLGGRSGFFCKLELLMVAWAPGDVPAGARPAVTSKYGAGVAV